MQFDQPLIPGLLLRRYQRFLADVQLDDGRVVTAHTPNTGSLRGCAEPGSRVWLRDSGDPKRRYPLSWVLVRPPGGVLVGIDTGLANRLARESIEGGVIRELAGYRRIRPEVRYGLERSRIDLLLEDGERPDAYVEVKNVTLVTDGIAYFPDAVTERGSKHLRELAAVAAQGLRAVILFCVQRADASELRPADAIDPVYGRTLRQALDQGVEALAYGAEPEVTGIELSRTLPVRL